MGLYTGVCIRCVCVYVYVYTGVRICVCIYLCMCIQVCVYVYVCITGMHMYMRIYVHEFAYMNILQSCVGEGISEPYSTVRNYKILAYFNS